MTPKIAPSLPDRAASSDENLLAPHELSAVETFRFEVSAGEKLALTAEGDHVPTRVDQPHSLRLNEQPRPASGPKVIRQSKRFTSARAYLGSLLINCGAIVGMGLVTISGLPHGFDFTLALTTDPGIVETSVIEEISIEPLEELQTLEADPNSEQVAVSDLTDDAALSELDSAALADNALAGVSNMFATSGGGLAEMVPSGSKLTASFFGTKVDGRRILYVLDNSGGMQDGELESLIDELLVSVDSLSSKQQFYVLFYSDMLYPLFYPRAAERFVPANDRFKQRLRTWLETVEFCMGNTVDQAIVAADQMRPDAVYLLTDGQLDQTRDQRRMAVLLDRRHRDYPIHTFGFLGTGWGIKKAEEQLRQVADGNDGTFRLVDISDEAVARAKKLNRPYHDKEPGREWGLNVGRSWGRK